MQVDECFFGTETILLAIYLMEYSTEAFATTVQTVQFMRFFSSSHTDNRKTSMIMLASYSLGLVNPSRESGAYACLIPYVVHL